MIELLNIDCMEYLKDCHHNEFDLAIVDPPYGIGADTAQNAAADSRIKANGNSKAGRGWVKYRETEWDKEVPTAEYFERLQIVSKNQIIWGGNYMVEHLRPSQGWVFWDKGQRDFSLADGELAYTSFDRALRVFEMSRGEALAKKTTRFHPTQKPVKLYEWLLTNYSEPGQRILDTHLGSGSSAIAAHYFGVDFVGMEIDKDYYDAAVKRFNAETAQLDIFG